MRTIVTLLSRIFKRQPAAFEQSVPASERPEQELRCAILNDWRNDQVKIITWQAGS